MPAGTGSLTPSRLAAGLLSPAPDLHEVTAPAHWRAIDFISDLHLCESMPRTRAAWGSHLQSTSADAVFMLGDLFDLWVGDDMRTRPFQHGCMQLMRGLAGLHKLGFMAGNRDFLVGSEMLDDCCMPPLPDPTVLNAFGHRVLLSHGDALCLDDHSYQAFRTQVRSPAWQAAFLARPLAERLEIAAQIRRASDGRRQFDGDGSADVDSAEALRWLNAAGADTLVHGHTHRPANHALSAAKRRLVLSDWDLDTGHRAEVLRLTATGFQRVAPALG